jgi:DNA-binding protein YbaB
VEAEASEELIIGGIREVNHLEDLEVATEVDLQDHLQEEMAEVDGILEAEKVDSLVSEEVVVSLEGKAEASAIAIDNHIILVEDSEIRTEMVIRGQSLRMPSDMRTEISKAAVVDSPEAMEETLVTEAVLQDLRQDLDSRLDSNQHKVVHRVKTKKERVDLSTKDQMGSYSWEDGLHSSNFEERLSNSLVPAMTTYKPN